MAQSDPQKTRPMPDYPKYGRIILIVICCISYQVLDHYPSQQLPAFAIGAFLLLSESGLLARSMVTRIEPDLPELKLLLYYGCGSCYFSVRAVPSCTPHDPNSGGGVIKRDLDRGPPQTEPLPTYLGR